ncbi:UDP-3-O-[3-hydroxymyristoyl] N-acetylglucosamine deacetylase [Halanaerobium sp. MA284_MarDTE_T2]|nr:UDP-3-O-[3-hydroxymyristoyl] N-acetylglucosamine deacetylase [Halanaerobium sp. MA284_MarDTE_T2]RCW85669.1 UDP-3-O-[3-hydroxymyristoyl] N-acetylglucosamine deacetylase [Halanaerobium sp. DL-01]
MKGMKHLFIEKNRQHTIKNEIDYKGIALHSGADAYIKIKEAPADSGIIFRRMDLQGKPYLKVKPSSVVDSRRCTTLGRKDKTDVRISTVEHLMAAIWASDLDNLMIEVDGPEIPVADGSAAPFFDLLQSAGKKEQKKNLFVFSIDRPLFARNGGSYITILPYDGFKISYTLDYDHPAVGTSFFEYDSKKDDFRDDLSRARTFGFEREIERLHKNGLALGGSLDNAVLIGNEKAINPMRFKNEFARHKVLDIVGDMALNGRIEGHIIAVKSGHSLHVELAALIREKMIEEEKKIG